MNRSPDASPSRRDPVELAALLTTVANGDSQALRSLYERTSAKLFGICLRLLEDRAEAQDVLQEVYVTVWRKAGRFDPDRASAITWLAVITRNKAVDHLRQRRTPVEDMRAAADAADESPTAIDVLQDAEEGERLARCLDELDERARTMIRLAFFEGATYSELAKRQDVPLPTMKSWIRRGLQSLKGCMER